MDLEDDNDKVHIINDGNFIKALMVMCITVGFGTFIVNGFDDAGITLPSYLGAMILGLAIRNICDMRGYDLPIREINTLGWICLAMFLSMALMSTCLWHLFDLASKMMVVLLVQTLLVALFAYFVVFRLTGRNYESGVLVSGMCGVGLGATPNAMANMEAITRMFGPAPRAYFVIPLIGSVFIDLINGLVLTVLMNFM